MRTKAGALPASVGTTLIGYVLTHVLAVAAQACQPVARSGQAGAPPPVLLTPVLLAV